MSSVLLTLKFWCPGIAACRYHVACTKVCHTRDHTQKGCKYVSSGFPGDLAEDFTYHVIITHKNKNLPADKAYAVAKQAVEKGAGIWGRTHITMLNPQTYQFILSCCTCNKECLITIPPNFWSSHSKKCRLGGNTITLVKSSYVCRMRSFYHINMFEITNIVPIVLVKCSMLKCAFVFKCVHHVHVATLVKSSYMCRMHSCF